VASEGLDPAELTETVATLVDKSLVTSDGGSAAPYRLLETTRAYAWQKLSESGEDQKIARRHCEQLTEALEEFGAQIWARPSPDSIDFFASNLSNLRAALDWCFSDHGGNALGARLSGASASLSFQAGLLPECITWTERAVGVLDPACAGTRLELELLACFSQSLMLTRGNIPPAQAAIVRALDIAQRLEAAPMELLWASGSSHQVCGRSMNFGCASALSIVKCRVEIRRCLVDARTFGLLSGDNIAPVPRTAYRVSQLRKSLLNKERTETSDRLQAGLQRGHLGAGRSSKAAGSARASSN
jgi:hypothetical protein